MSIPFLNRKDEERRLKAVLRADPPVLAVIYGRRRCGKSTLLRRVAGPQDVYFLASQNDAALQRAALASQIGRVVDGFEAAVYPSWEALLKNLAERTQRRISLFIDEFPYLAQTSPELPSVLQAFLEGVGAARVNLVLCGSSQRMMHGLVLDRCAWVGWREGRGCLCGLGWRAALLGVGEGLSDTGVCRRGACSRSQWSAA
jgi:AAA+ ATPase superfamily predicted ATPase